MLGRTRRPSWFVVVLALLVILQTATPVWAWGRLGHRVIAKLAEKKLNPKAKAAIAKLLDEGESIADASTPGNPNAGAAPGTNRSAVSRASKRGCA